MPMNAAMTPSTVPSSPMSGLTEPIVASHGTNRDSDRAPRSSRASSTQSQRLDLRATQPRRCAPTTRASAGFVCGEELHRAIEHARERARRRVLRECRRPRRATARARSLRMNPSAAFRTRRNSTHLPNIIAQLRSDNTASNDEHDLRDERRVRDQLPSGSWESACADLEVSRGAITSC